MNFEKWISIGIENKWCTPVYCATHDGQPITPDESDDMESGGDPCIYAVRMCQDDAEHDAVMQNNRFQ